MSEDLILPGEDEPVFARPSNPGADALLGVKVPLLDHGFVRLVDYMGGDDAIVQAARTSYGRGTRTPSSDAALINTLMRDWHTSVFEMCLAGDTRIQTFPCKGAKVKHYAIRDIAREFENPTNGWAKVINIRTVNPDTGVVASTKIKFAKSMGFKEVFLIQTDDAFPRSIKVTSNHPILTPDGFRNIDQGLAAGDCVMLNGTRAFAEDVVQEIQRRRASGEPIKSVAKALGISPSSVWNHAPGRAKRKTGFFKKKMGDHLDPHALARRLLPDLGACEAQGCERPAEDRHHIDHNQHNNVKENLIRLCAMHHRHSHTFSRLEKAFPVKIKSITRLGVEEVFDLEVHDDNHTFVAEGIVVHNCEFKFHIKMPIFVARQWIRHRMANLNEYSGRYSVMDREFYIPSPDVLARQSLGNKQGREGPLSPEESGRVLELLKQDAERAFDDYDEMIDEDGIRLSRELARINLPLSTYTQMYWKIDLHNLLNFLRLRMDAHAQYEIRVFAEAIGRIVADACPMAWDAFREYRLEAMQLSAKEIVALRDILAGHAPVMEAFTSARERKAFEAKMARLQAA